MREHSSYIIERCEGFRIVIEEATVRTYRMRRAVPCEARFETSSATGTCPECGMAFEILWNRPSAPVVVEEPVTVGELVNEHV